MNIELNMLWILGNDHNLFRRLKPYIKDHTFSKEGLAVYKALAGFYAAVPTASCVDWNNLGTHFLATTKLSSTDAEMYRLLFDRLSELELSSLEADTQEVLNHYITMDYATRIIDTAMRVAEGDKTASLDDVLKNIQEFHREIKTADSTKALFASPDMTEIVDRVASAGWEWRLEPLNISLGPLRTGDFVIVAARPETGKTTLLASELTHFGSQMPASDDRPIIWVNNEEDSSKVMFRTQQAALGCTVPSIMCDPTKAMSEYEKLMNGKKDRILILQKSHKRNHVDYLDGLFREMNPAIIVFDQLDKVHGFNREARDDLRLGKLYGWARDLTETCAVIAVSQVNGSGEGQQYIYQDQLRGSTTDKAGEADAIITIGRVNGNPSLINSRFIHVPKNKLFGGPRSDEAHRHGFWEVAIKPEIARYVYKP